MSVAGLPTPDSEFPFSASRARFRDSGESYSQSHSPDSTGIFTEGVPLWNVITPFEDDSGGGLIDGSFGSCLEQAPAETRSSATGEQQESDESTYLMTLALASLWMIPQAAPVVDGCPDNSCWVDNVAPALTDGALSGGITAPMGVADSAQDIQNGTSELKQSSEPLAYPLQLPLQTQPAPEYLSSNDSLTGRSEGNSQQQGTQNLFEKSRVDGKPVRVGRELAFELRLRPLVNAPQNAQLNPRVAPSDVKTSERAPTAAERQQPGNIPDALPRLRSSEENSLMPPRQEIARAGDPDRNAPNQASTEISPATRVTVPLPHSHSSIAVFPGSQPEPTHSEPVSPKAPVVEVRQPDWMPSGPPAASLRDLHFQVEGPEGRHVSVRVHDKEGQVHVAVHTTNPDQARALRERVAELIGNIERHGFRADTSGLASLDASSRGGASDRQDQGEHHHAGPFSEEPNQPNGSGHQQRRQHQPEPQEVSESSSSASLATGKSWSTELETAVSGEE